MHLANAIGLAACFWVACDAHGFITKPISRNSLVCDAKWPDYLKHYNNNNFWCKTDRESHCPYMPGPMKDCQGNSTGKYPGAGVPLEPYCQAGHDKRFKSGELNDLSKPGPVQPENIYTAGDVVEMTWQVAANHGGKYQYRICLDGSDNEDCFKKLILKTDKGETWIKVTGGAHPIENAKIKIPDDLECERCTLSLRWDGSSESVIFASCADIQIKRKGPSPPGPKPTPSPPGPAPTPAPPPSPTLPPATKTCPKCGGGACGCSWVKSTKMCEGPGDGSCCFKCCCGKDLEWV